MRDSGLEDSSKKKNPLLYNSIKAVSWYSKSYWTLKSVAKEINDFPLMPPVVNVGLATEGPSLINYYLIGSQCLHFEWLKLNSFPFKLGTCHIIAVGS